MDSKIDDLHLTKAWLNPGLHRKIASASRQHRISIFALADEVGMIIEKNKNVGTFAELDIFYSFGAELHYSLSEAPHLRDVFLENFNKKAAGKPKSFALEAFLGGYEGKTLDASTPAFP